MADGFDPYEAWLGVSKEQRPINVYLLLGLPLCESDPRRIEAAARERLALLESQKSGPHGSHAEKLIEMVGEGLKVLQDPKKKAKYDERLREKSGATPTVAPPASPIPTPPAAPVPPPVHAATAARQAKLVTAAPIASAAPIAHGAPIAGVPVAAAAAPVGGPLVAPVAAIPAGVPVGVAAPVAAVPAARGVPVGAAAPVGAFPVEGFAAGPASRGGSGGGYDPNREKDRKKQQQLTMVMGLLGAMVVLAGVAIYVASSPPAVAKKPAKKVEEEVAATTIVDLDPEAAKKRDDSGRALQDDGADKAAAADAAGKPSEKQTDGKKPGRLRDRRKSSAGADREAEMSGGSDARAAAAAPGAPTAAAAMEADAAPAASEPDDVAWAVAADVSPSPPLPLDQTLVSTLKPDFAARHFAIDPAWKTVALAADAGKIAIYDLEAKAQKSSFALAGGRVLALALLGADRLLVWSEPGGLQTLNVADGSPLAQWPAPTEGGSPEAGVAVSPGGKFVAIVRDGIRFYETAGGALAGVVKIAPDDSVAAIGFDPEGQRLRALVQSPRSHRVVDYDLATGKPVSDGTKPCPGQLSGVRGPFHTRTGSGGKFLYCGRYMLKSDDGFPAIRIEKPPAIVFPLAGGGLWIGDGGPLEFARLDWEKLTRSIQTFDAGRQPAQIGPNERIAVIVEPSGVPADRVAEVTERVTNVLKERFEGYGMTINEFAPTVCTVKYKEAPAGKIDGLRYREADGGAVEKPLELDGVKTTIEITITNSDVGKEESLFKYNVELPPSGSRLIVPLADAEKPAADAYLAARIAWLGDQLAGFDLPYYLSKGILGTTRLPIVTPKVVPGEPAAP